MPPWVADIADLGVLPIIVWVVIRVEKVRTDIDWLKRFHQNGNKDPDQ